MHHITVHNTNIASCLAAATSKSGELVFHVPHVLLIFSLGILGANKMKKTLGNRDLEARTKNTSTPDGAN